ncbi:hypothetical protein, partial [Bradyrhizobium sp.]|uniref:hypothetical protein n=1 Tax=Bradyrhizobium sp. TaxID=376 RepID=UPI0025C0D20D
GCFRSRKGRVFPGISRTLPLPTGKPQALTFLEIKAFFARTHIRSRRFGWFRSGSNTPVRGRSVAARTVIRGEGKGGSRPRWVSQRWMRLRTVPYSIALSPATLPSNDTFIERDELRSTKIFFAECRKLGGVGLRTGNCSARACALSSFQRSAALFTES